MSLEILRTPLGGSPLVRDYLRNSGDARRFYPAGDPFRADTYARHWARVRDRFSSSQREQAAAALVPTSELAARRLARWVREGGAVVTTGQQAGLFTGPLFTIYKALTAVRLARELESRIGVLVLPVFWVASEDHDWQEANHAYAIGPDHRLVRLLAPTSEPTDLPLALSERTLHEGIDSTLDELSQIIAHEAFDASYLKWIQDSYRGGRAMGVAFGEVMRRVLEPFDAFVVDAADPAVKGASIGVLSRSLHEEAAEEQVLRAWGDDLGKAGYSQQVAILGRSPNVFVRTSHGRERLIRMKDGGWMANESGLRLTAEEMSARVATEPESLSPNVLLRPVVESAVFPVLAYVAGPGEIAYWGQLGGLFAHHGLAMPAVYPRASFLLIDSEIRAAMHEAGLTVEEVGRPVHELLTRRAMERLPEGVRAVLAELRASIVERFDTVMPAAAALDPTLAGAVGAARNRALLEANRLERKVVRAQKRLEGEWGGLVERVKLHLQPLGKPQERVLNGIPYLAREGEMLLHRLLEQIPSPFVGASEASNEVAGEVSARAD